MVPTFCVQALSGQPLTIFGSGLQTRSLCYVSDTVGGLMALMETPGIDGEVVNLGCPDERTVLEIAQTIAALAGSSCRIERGPLPVDDPARRCPDIGKAQRLLGWRPETDLSDRARAHARLFPRGSRPRPRRGGVARDALIPTLLHAYPSSPTLLPSERGEGSTLLGCKPLSWLRRAGYASGWRLGVRAFEGVRREGTGAMLCSRHLIQRAARHHATLLRSFPGTRHDRRSSTNRGSEKSRVTGRTR